MGRHVAAHAKAANQLVDAILQRLGLGTRDRRHSRVIISPPVHNNARAVRAAVLAADMSRVGIENAGRLERWPKAVMAVGVAIAVRVLRTAVLLVAVTSTRIRRGGDSTRGAVVCGAIRIAGFQSREVALPLVGN
jgi:hypothetical protein